MYQLPCDASNVKNLDTTKRYAEDGKYGKRDPMAMNEWM